MSNIDEFINKTIIVGLTYLDNEEKIKEQLQYSGVIIGFDSRGWIAIKLDENEDFSIPPDLKAITPAPEGEYSFRSTNKIVTNPDYMATYTIYPPQE